MSVLGSGCPLLRRYCCELLCPGAVKNRGVWFSPVGPNGSESLMPSAPVAGKPREEGAWAWARGLEDTDSAW